MASESKVARLILQLTKLTVDKGIEWKVCDPPRALIQGTDDVVSLYLETEYKGQFLALYHRRYRAYDGDNDVTYWADEVHVAILDAEERIVWEHTDGSSALTNLFTVARESAANIDGILDSLLN
jgi:hypothetical protein